MRRIKSPIRSSTGCFESRYAGNSPPACAESAGGWNSAALTAVTTNKSEYFVNTSHLLLEGGQFCPQPAFSRLGPPKKAAAAMIGRPPRHPALNTDKP
jgi:hypothetical protein